MNIGKVVERSFGKNMSKGYDHLRDFERSTTKRAMSAAFSKA
jgi:hypothetical protein